MPLQGTIAMENSKSIALGLGHTMVPIPSHGNISTSKERAVKRASKPMFRVVERTLVAALEHTLLTYIPCKL